MRLTFSDEESKDGDFTARNENNRRKRSKLTCPSICKVQESARMLEECGKKFGLKFFTMPSSGHKCIVFDCNNLLKFIFKIFKLDFLANELEGIEIALTLDRAALTNNLSHVTCGVKIVDVIARDPSTNRLVLYFQSRDHSFVFE